MKESNRLFELIKAMSGSEKGYFKKYTFIHAKTQEQIYLKMFNIISSQKEYDENKLIKELKKKSASKKFGSLQSYLYKLILKSLRAYHSEGSFSIKTVELLTDSILLKEKGLIAQSNKILERAKESAIGEDDQVLLLKIQQLQEENNRKKSSIKLLEFNCEDLHLEINKLVINIKQEIEINHLQNKIYLIYLKYGMGITDPEVRTEVEKILKDPLLNIDQKNLARNILYEVFRIINLCYTVLGDNAASVNTYKMYIAALEKDPLFHTERIKIRYGILLGSMLSQYAILKTDELQEIFKKIKSLKISSPRQVDFFSYSFSNMLGVYANLQMPEKGVALIPEALKKLNAYKNQLSDESLLLIQYNICTLYFMINDYANALKWMNKTLDLYTKNIRQDTHSDMRLLNILIHYELGNYQLFDSLLTSLERLLTKNKSMNASSKNLIYHLKKLTFLRDKKEIYEQINKLSPLLKEKDEWPAHIISWIEKKLKLNQPR